MIIFLCSSRISICVVSPHCRYSRRTSVSFITTRFERPFFLRPPTQASSVTVFPWRYIYREKKSRHGLIDRMIPGGMSDRAPSENPVQRNTERIAVEDQATQQRLYHEVDTSLRSEATSRLSQTVPDGGAIEWFEPIHLCDHSPRSLGNYSVDTQPGIWFDQGSLFCSYSP